MDKKFWNEYNRLSDQLKEIEKTITLTIDDMESYKLNIEEYQSAIEKRKDWILKNENDMKNLKIKQKELKKQLTELFDQRNESDPK